MRKNPSKSTLTKKNKTPYTAPESRKNSRLVKTNSCIKVNSQNTEQNSHYNATINKSNLQSLSQKLLAQITSQQPTHRIDKPNQSQRQSTLNNMGKSSIETAPSHTLCKDELKQSKQKNEQLAKENTELKQRCCELQEMSLKDKEKIKNLIIRINEVKQGQSRQLNTDNKTQHPSTNRLNQLSANSCALLSQKSKLQTPFKALTGHCDSLQCAQRKKYLESELYKQRIARDKLQMQKRDWQHNRVLLKQQYNDLLQQIRDLRNQN